MPAEREQINKFFIMKRRHLTKKGTRKHKDAPTCQSWEPGTSKTSVLFLRKRGFYLVLVRCVSPDSGCCRASLADCPGCCTGCPGTGPDCCTGAPCTGGGPDWRCTGWWPCTAVGPGWCSVSPLPWCIWCPPSSVGPPGGWWWPRPSGWPGRPPHSRRTPTDQQQSSVTAA